MRDRISAQTDQEREARLQAMRDRISAQTDQEREARLQTMRDRISAQTDQERESHFKQCGTEYQRRPTRKENNDFT